MAEQVAPAFLARNRNFLLGCLSVALFFAALQAVFLFVPFDPLFISKPNLIALALLDLISSGDLAHDLAVSAVPFFYGFAAAVLGGVVFGMAGDGWPGEGFDIH